MAEAYKYYSIGDYRFNKSPDDRCGSCWHFKEINDSDYRYKCDGDTGSKAALLGQHKAAGGKCEAYEKPPDGAILDRKPRPKLVKLLITGLIVSIVWALVIIVYGKVRSNLAIGTPFVLTFICGIPVGTIVFTLLRLLKNLINKGATAVGNAGRMGGNLFGWIVSSFLPWVSPVIAFLVLAGVFGAKIF
jgi:hypothetical protein